MNWKTINDNTAGHDFLVFMVLKKSGRLYLLPFTFTGRTLWLVGV